MLHSKIKQDLLHIKNELESKGIIYSKEQLDKYYTTFQRKFSPDILQSWNGEELLTNMHLFGDKDSLAYWLEFKNDNELPFQFGGIGGGSALKYGIYFSKDKKEWFTGSSTKQKQITTDEAISIVKFQRDQLIAGYDVLSKLPHDSSLEKYYNMQAELKKVMPDIFNLGWPHKYLTMHFPNKLDDFHSSNWQKFNLLKILIIPEVTEERYVNAYHFVNVAKELEISINTLTTILKERNGKPIKYWRIGTTSGGTNQDRFSIMNNADKPCIAIGWDEIHEDLSRISKSNESKEELRTIIKENYSNRDPKMIGRYTQQIFNFLVGIDIDDYVICMDGAKVRGIGVVTDSYYYEKDGEFFRHRKPVKWLNLEEWKLNDPEGLQTTVHQFKKKPQNIIDIESKIQLEIPNEIPQAISSEISLTGFTAKLESILKRKGQVILYGPPGTGKTYWANKAANEIAAIKNLNNAYNSLSESEKKHLHDSYIQLCTFHPAYGYEDFMEAYRPVNNHTNISFELKPGIFKKLCTEASTKTDKKYILIIDEINRGDIPRIFGELITLLEVDKRNTQAKLPVSGESFFVPPNIYIIATMNTADKSIALLDTALRRRFGFIEMMPDYDLLRSSSVDDLPLESWLKVLNKRIRANLGQNGRNLQIGHSYLLSNGKPITDPKLFLKVVREDIIPLLEEYCYEDYLLLEKILSKEIVNSANYEINNQIFDDANWDKIKQALMLSDPEMLTESVETQDVDLDENDEGEKENGTE